MSVYVLHGTFGNPYENWFGWLNSKLSEVGITCFTPHLPTPQGQTFDNWGRIIDAYVESSLLSNKSTLIGHSSSSVFLVKYLADRQISVKSLITVCGFNSFISGMDEFDKLNSELYVTKEEEETFVKLQIPTTCIYSNNDPYLPLDQLESFIKAINGEPMIVDGGGHFNTDAGYTEFSQLFDLIIKQNKS